MLRPSAAVAVLSLSACHITLHDHVTVDGVRLKFHHEELLTLEAWPEGGLTIAAHQGDVRVEHTDGPTTLRVVVYERAPGDAHAHIEDGRLASRGAGGGASAIGDVVLATAGPARALTLSTGMGDVTLNGVLVEGKLELSTGMGDVEVRHAGEPSSIAASTGMGDVTVTHVHCTRLEAETGMGDVSVEGIEADEAELSSGMGDVDVQDSRGGRIEASSGMGDVELVSSSFTTRQLDTGLGRARQR